MLRTLMCILILPLLLSACAGNPPTTTAEKETRLNELYQGYRQEFPEVKECTVEDVLAMRRTDDPVVVDVRTPAEWNVSMLPGAITKLDFEAHKEKYAHRPVILYCTAGYRSGRYARQLSKERSGVCNLASGILGWLHAGQPVVDKEGNEVKRVHVYGKQWDLATDDVKTLWK